MAMKKILVLTLAVGTSLAFANSASAAAVTCAAPGGGSVSISCATNADGSLAASCACPAGYILIDPTETQPLGGNGPEPTTPTVPSRT
jgi:hypothetical protein